MEYDADIAPRLKRGQVVSRATVIFWICGHVMHLTNGDMIPNCCPKCGVRASDAWVA